jgi:hypothetical protein
VSHQTKQKKQKQITYNKMSETYNVIRNTVVKVLDKYKIIRGENKDKEYLAPTISAETLDSDINWLGRDTVVSVLQTFVKRASQELWLDNVDANGVMNIPKFLEELKELTSASLKLADLKEKYDELVAKQGMLVDRLTDEPEPQLLVEIKNLGTAIKVVKAQMEAKSRKNKPEVTAEAAVSVS